MKTTVTHRSSDDIGSGTKCGLGIGQRDNLSFKWTKVTCKNCLRVREGELRVHAMEITHKGTLTGHTECGRDAACSNVNVVKGDWLRVNCLQCLRSKKSKKIIHKLKGRTLQFVWTRAKCGIVINSCRVTARWEKVTCKQCLKKRTVPVVHKMSARSRWESKCGKQCPYHPTNKRTNVSWAGVTCIQCLKTKGK